VLDVNCAITSKERLEEEQRASRSCQEHAEQLRRRCEQLEHSEQDLLDQVQRHGSQRQALEAQCEELGSRLGTATEAARRVKGEKKLLEAELERVQQQQRDSEQGAQDLRCRAKSLEDQLKEMRDHRQRVEQDQNDAEQELQQWYQKCIEAERGNAGLLRQSQELRRDFWELSVQMQQERNVANICSPGEFLKLMKACEGESLAVDHGRLQKQLVKTQCDLELCLRKLSEQETVIRTLQCMQKD
jgi:chromosome segregation ATPase